MSRKRIGVAVLFLTLVAAALFFRQPIQSWAATQACVRMGRDHYANVENLQGAPALDDYMAQIRLQCRAEVVHDAFEAAETSESRREQGERAIALYGELIATSETGNGYRPRRAALYAALGEHEQALADYNFLLVHDPDNYWVLEQRGELYAQIGRYDEAVADFEQLYERARQDESNGDAYLDRINRRLQELEAQR